MHTTHDPYLNTAKRSLQNKQCRKRKQQYEEKLYHRQQESFLGQKIVLHNYLNLPESLQNIVVLILFMFLPYTIGTAFTFLIVAHASIELYKQINVTSFLLLWTIGYEIMAFFLLSLIIKSALLFKKTL
jgi:hypothetical protein